MPLESIDKIAEADQVTYAGVWRDVQQRAALRFENDIVRAFQSKYQIRNVTQSLDLLKFIDTVNDQTAAAAKWRGFTIELVQSNIYHWVQSALQTIHIQSIWLYRKAVTAAVTAKVFNLETGEVLATITIPVNTAAGWTEVNVNTRFFAPRLFVAFDSTAVDCVEGDITSDIINRFSDCACAIFNDCEGAINGAQSTSLLTSVTDSDIATGNNMFGLSGIFSIGCSYYSLVCQNKTQFLMAWAFLLGREMMWERTNSSRINRWTTIDKDKANEQMEKFNTEYLKELDTVTAGFSLNTGDCCLECNAPVQYRESMM
jgi:hypothetical protein